MKIFVSSVQSEFAAERKALARYIREDPVLGEFFEVFLFEEQPARSRPPQAVYLAEVESCDIYLGLFGAKYGSRDVEGVSPTEREYDCARNLGKTCFGFVKNGVKREKEEDRFVREKIDRELSRNPFRDFTGLKAGVYKTLVNYLKEDDLISNKPFDESFSRKVKLSDLSSEKIRDYVRLVRTAGKVSFPADISDMDVLTRIGAMEPASGRITNAAIPLFATHPEMTKPAWEIRCLHFYGTEVEKPIPSLHTYTGTVFELVDQALEFVMSRVDFMIGKRGGPTAAAPTKAEFPRDAVQEAIVNAVCHRDYRSTGCVQVMLFRDRLEIINPGTLPKGWTVEKLYEAHDSKPRNEIIARAMSWTSYVEKSGSGTGDILRQCRAWGLATPKYLPDNVDFKTIIWRNGGPSRGAESTPSRHSVAGSSRDPVGTQSAFSRGTQSAPSRGTQSNGPKSMGLSCGPKSGAQVIAPSDRPKSGEVIGEVAGEVVGEVAGEVVGEVAGGVKGEVSLSMAERIIQMLEFSELRSAAIARGFGWNKVYGALSLRLKQMLEDKVIAYTIPLKPRSRLQKYRLTAKGRRLATKLAGRGDPRAPRKTKGGGR